MRVPLGFLSRSTRLSTHAAPWPYLRRFMPRRLISIGLGDPEAAALYRPGVELVIAAAGLAPHGVTEHLRALGEARHAAWHRGPVGWRPEAGFDPWRALWPEVTLDLRRDSPVWSTDGGLQVRLLTTLSARVFADTLRDAIDIVSLDAVVLSRQGRRRCRELDLHPGRYQRETAHAVGGRILKARADDLHFFCPGLDADALVAFVEMVVAGRLADLAQGIAGPMSD